MVRISCSRDKTYYTKQVEAINSFFQSEKLKNNSIDFETAFSMWLTNGYGERFRQLYLVNRHQYN